MVLLISDNNEYAHEIEQAYSVQRVENPAQYISVMDLIPKYLIIKKTKNGVNARTAPDILPATKCELIRSRTTLTVSALQRDAAYPNRIWVRTKSGLYILYDPEYCVLKWS